MIRKRRIFLIGAAIGLTAAALAVQFIRPARKGTWARIQREGLIRIGYSVEAPYVFLDERGELKGIEVDVARAVMERAGVPGIVWVQANVGSLLSEARRGANGRHFKPIHHPGARATRRFFRTHIPRPAGAPGQGG